MGGTAKVTGTTTLVNDNKIEKPKKAETKSETTPVIIVTEKQPEENISLAGASLGKAIPAYEITNFKDRKYTNAEYRTYGATGNIALQAVFSKEVNPVGATLGGMVFLAMDASDAKDKTDDPKVSKTSAALAWATVGIDAANVANGLGLMSKIVSKPIGWTLDAASLATSWLSDITANQSVEEANKKEAAKK